ncbi:dolichyl-phosphate-mannose-protein mannosyltransferase [Microbacterium mangrovi]|uniref:Polyprenol-phosphate-mannose--protein mannosyltransferase n=1 Tax=Microbacterium mangrovi TaxID=1348253 RepID=A0A0B2A9T6_9MICO|nr:phospholipid carrier-dependent glycosyltransferase [Microbacterium mangrovi]KHK98523.1 dolichyl-phosphate-mannose-protein mannosyltransferase [Microbacterium mangrovi]
MATADLLIPDTKPSLYDRWAVRVRANARQRRLWRWLAPTLVTLLAALLRFVNLGHPHAIVFDETYYVKDAWSQWNLGYPGTWPPNVDEAFARGHTDLYTAVGSFVVHPPLGKWIMGVGMWLFGPDSSFGWRFSVAVAGTATVLLLYFVAKRLTGSIVFATIPAFLLAIDGVGIVMSRVGLLDGILTFFILLTFWFVLLDRERQLGRLAGLIAARADDDGAVRWGPVMWSRWWLMAAAVSAGAATAVKWSGLYLIAAVGIYVIVTDMLARRRLGVDFWALDGLRQGLASFLVSVPVAFVVYLASWTGWLVTDKGWDRHAADAHPATGLFSWVPLPLQSLWLYHQEMYRFNVSLTTPHSYQSPAWQWPLLIRPTSMYWSQQKGCGDANGCVQAISSIPNPLIWWGGVAAAIFLLIAFVLRRNWKYAFVLTGIAATYLPWLQYPQRTIFQFYTIAMLPFLLLALAFALREIAGRPDADNRRRLAGQRVVVVYLVIVTLVSAFWYPVWTGMEVPYEYWRLHNWMSTWV